MDIQQVEQHFESLDLSVMKPGGALYFTASDVKQTPGIVLQKVCGIYKIVKPFLGVIAGLFFVPAKWRASLSGFIALMDTICP